MATTPAGCTRRELLAALAGLWVLPEPARASMPHREAHFLFGSPAELMLRLPEGATPPAASGEVWAELARIHWRWNAWKPGDVTELNAALRRSRVARTTPELVALIRMSARLERASAGCFNAGIGGGVGAWGFHDDRLDAGERPRARELAGWREARPSLAQLEIDGLAVRSRNPFVQLDFGAIAKGVAVDRALDHLARRGCGEALINLGGNLAAMGAPWSIGIRDPIDGGGLLARLRTCGREAVVTSGSYERFRMLDGERFTHILDPGSMAPAPELVSVTVLHASAALADAAATALLVAGPSRWRVVAARLGVAQVLVVDRHGQGQATPALMPRLHFESASQRQRVSPG